MYAYSHKSMFIRTALAAMDHNENLDREQKVSGSGYLMWDYIKQRHGKRYYVKPIKVNKDHGWRNTLASLVLSCVRTDSVPTVNIPLGEELPKFRKEINKPEKADAVQKHQSRFL